MAKFRYRARDRRGAALSGVIDAETAEAVAEQLFQSEITPIEIDIEDEASASLFAGLRERLSRRAVKSDELVLLAREMYTLSRAGIPIIRSLRGLAASTPNRTLVDILNSLADDLEAGHDLATALGRHQSTFSPLFISLVRVGETTGRLDEAFLQLSEHLDAERENRERIKSAMRYPMVVIGAMMIAMGVINVFVIPAFSGVFERLGADLPLATRLLMATSSFTLNWWPLMLAGGVLGSIALRIWLRTGPGRYHWGRAKLKIPLTGSIIYRATLARFVRSLGLALRSGVPLLQSLSVAAGALDNDFLESRVLDMRSGIEHGESLSRTAASTGLFTPLILQMLGVGEETGALDELLIETAAHYEREVSYDLKTLNDSLEPILISAMGVLVLILALGVFLPMWDLAGAARGG